MDNDDLPIGRVLDRREALRILALTGAAVLVGCDRSNASAATTSATTAIPGCVVRPELTEGPYFVDHQLDRQDIRTDPSTGKVKEGLPLYLTFKVSQITNNKCAPLAGAHVDVWHCDSDGVYSGVTDRTVGFNTVDQKFLRGFQQTNSDGVAQFTTIYPGWYQGRTVHIHFKIRAPWAPGAKVTDQSKQFDFTSQLFFDDALSDKVFAQAPYKVKGERHVRNAGDGIFREAGESLILKPTESSRGYAATFDMALDLSDVSVGS